MRFKTWPVAALGLGSLLAADRRVDADVVAQAQEIYTQLDQLNTHHHDVDAKLRRLRSDVNLSGIFVRDYLLDVARERAPEYRERLAEFRQTNMATVAELRALAEPHADQILQPPNEARRLLADVRSAVRLDADREDLPQRQLPAARGGAAARGGSGDRAGDRGAEQREPGRAARRGHTAAGRLPRRPASVALAAVCCSASAVALTVVFRLRVLERRSEEQRAIAEEAERQMRQLSQRLVATQEEERKNLSRELHDHVAQVLTALRMELGRIERGRGRRATRGSARPWPNARQLVDSMFRTVRDLALGLRPSMLDDFGLQPALEWHVRDFTRRYGVDVELTVDGDFDDLPDRLSDVRVSSDPGGADQLRPPRGGARHQGERDRPRRSTGCLRDRRWHRSRSRAAPRWPGSARHRGAREGTARRR